MCSIRVYEVGRKGKDVTDIYWDDSPANFENGLSLSSACLQWWDSQQPCFENITQPFGHF